MANRSLNKVMLIGNLTRDPDLRYIPSGVAVCTFGLATNRQWTDSEGTPQESTEFHRLVAWGKLAEICSQLLFKGRKIYIEGRLQTREWTGQDGNKRTTTEIVLDSMLILDTKMKAEVSGEEMSGSPAVSSPMPTPKVKSVVTKGDKTDGDEKKEEEGEEDKDKKVKAEDIPF